MTWRRGAYSRSRTDKARANIYLTGQCLSTRITHLYYYNFCCPSFNRLLFFSTGFTGVICNIVSAGIKYFEHSGQHNYIMKHEARIHRTNYRYVWYRRDHVIKIQLSAQVLACWQWMKDHTQQDSFYFCLLFKAFSTSTQSVYLAFSDFFSVIYIYWSTVGKSILHKDCSPFPNTQMAVQITFKSLQWLH